MNTNNWEAEGWEAEGEENDSELIYAEGDDAELIYAENEAEVLLNADGSFFEAKGRKKGFWSRLFGKEENAQRTETHTEQKVAQSVDASIAQQAGAFSRKLVMQGVQPDVANDAAIGRAVRLTERKKKSRKKGTAIGKPIPRFQRKADYIVYRKKQDVKTEEEAEQSENVCRER
mgnify:CR=1 FL=1